MQTGRQQERASGQCVSDRSASQPLAQTTTGGVPASGGAHIPALDGIRGLAILLVMTCHGTILPSESTLQDYFCRLTRVGWCGVDLFFVLSGFLITGILFDAKGAAHYFRNFYARRLFRIFPLYYAFLGVVLFLLPGFFGVTEELFRGQSWLWLYLSNIWIVVRGDRLSYPIDITWSLAIEEQFYLLWPAVVLWLNRRVLMTICAVVLPFSLVLRTGLLLWDAHPDTVYFLTITRLDGLAMGALVALWIRGPGGVTKLVPLARKVCVFAAATLIGVFLLQRDFAHEGPIVQTAGFSALALFFGAVLILVIGLPETGRLTRVFESSGLQTLGRYSYALYLMHVPVQLFVYDKVLGRDEINTYIGMPFVGQFMFYAITFSTTMGLAWLSWQLYEKHFLKLKRYFPSQPAACRSGERVTQTA